jgi:hypothetical protein
MLTHLEETLRLANEARFKGYENADPLWHAVADLEVTRVTQLGRVLADDVLTDEPCGFVPEPVVEFAPIWKEGLSDALLVFRDSNEPAQVHWIDREAVGT